MCEVKRLITPSYYQLIGIFAPKRSGGVDRRSRACPEEEVNLRVKKCSGINKDFGKLSVHYNNFKYVLINSRIYELDKAILCVNDCIDIYTHGILRSKCVLSRIYGN